VSQQQSSLFGINVLSRRGIHARQAVMSRRRKWFLFACSASLVTIALWHNLARSRHGDVWERYAQIHEGMSKDEVVTLFGVPPGQYNSRPVAICGTGQQESFAAVDKCDSKSVWLFDDGVFEIGFDENLKVEKMVASANMRGPPSIWDRLRYALGL
jgi:hypothetical protein